MEVLATIGEFATWFGTLLRTTAQDSGENFEYEVTSFSTPIRAVLPKREVEEALEQLRLLNGFGETTLTHSRSYEVLLRDESVFSNFRSRVRGEAFQLTDNDNSIAYEISPPTNSYILFLLQAIAPTGNLASISTPFLPNRSFDVENNPEMANVFNLLRKFFLRIITLKLRSDRARSVADFEKYSSSMLFQLSFNLNTALVPQRHLDELVRTGRITRIRRSNLADIDPPRRHYLPDLVYHYQLAVAADNPVLEYISYYHVAEHFFEAVFNDDLITRIKNKITLPDFSYKRKKDVALLVKDISKSLQIRNEHITINEQEGLRLTIERYVDLAALATQINNFDQSLLTYYSTTKIQFAGADEVNLNEGDQGVVRKKLAARIYKTRNSIVHSKESDKSKFVPFKDDRSLLKEIPLIRFIAEQVIISSSMVIE